MLAGKAGRDLLHRLTDLLARTRALVSGDHVLIRKGMLVVATQEIVEPHREVVGASEDLGEVLVVMRLRLISVLIRFRLLLRLLLVCTP